MNTKINPRLIDIAYIDRELVNLFASVHWGKGDELLTKYKSRFIKEQELKKNPKSTRARNGILSVGKKLQILCTYGNHRIVKVDRRA